jgi:hypothetical protein
MAQGTIVFLGSLQVETAALGYLLPEFGWSLAFASDLENLRKLSDASNLVAVLFDAHSLGLSWQDALRLVREASSPALPIACFRLSESVDWPALAESGAFHALALPFDRSEVRQSLGFVSLARSQRLANVLSISSLERLGAAMECRCGQIPCQCAAETAANGVRVIRAAG